jgi:trimeric autotransporter adhesin
MKLVYALMLVTLLPNLSILAAQDDPGGPNNTVPPPLYHAFDIEFVPNYSSYQTFASGMDPQSVAAADLNGDGMPDLIVANFFDNTVSVLLNTTAPEARTLNFATQQIFAAGSSPKSVAIADVNGDGKPDLLIADYNGNTISVLINTTAAGATALSFAAQQTFATGTTPYSVVTADINGDGKPDLIVANSGTFDDTVSVMLNTTAEGAATPSFATQKTFATGTNPQSVTAADINGDGKPDLIVANLDDGTVSVLLNTTVTGAATLGFATPMTFPAGSGSSCVVAVDVNGDGHPDLVVANANDDTVSVLINITAPGAATPSFTAQQTFATGAYPRSVAAADVNGDGTLDLVVANSNFNTLSVLLNTTAPGSTTPSFARQKILATGAFPDSVIAVDLNGDHTLDVIVANGNDASVSAFLNTPPNDAIFADGFD